MAFNKNFHVPRKSVEWQGQVICDVRGLTANDIMRAVAENEDDLTKLIELFDTERLAGAAATLGEPSILEKLQANSQKIFSAILMAVPILVAKVAAMAADDDDAWPEFGKMVLPLQIEIVTEILKLTFIDGEGFKRFLGNVMGLIESTTKKSDQPRIAPDTSLPGNTTG